MVLNNTVIDVGSISQYSYFYSYCVHPQTIWGQVLWGLFFIEFVNDVLRDSEIKHCISKTIIKNIYIYIYMINICEIIDSFEGFNLM